MPRRRRAPVALLPATLPSPRGVPRDACAHYLTGCSVVAPCCRRVFHCRRCHDEVADHALPRAAIEQLACRRCAAIQPVAASCRACGEQFGRAYSCLACRVFDDADRGQYHCEDCGVCRVGGRHAFEHCGRCGCCIAAADFAGHRCVEQLLGACPVCLEDLFDSQEAISKLTCGHALHAACLDSLIGNSGRNTCPLCNASIVRPSLAALRREVAETPMPEEYRGLRVEVLCNDCQARSMADFHVLGIECPRCQSWNTRRV